MRTAIPNPVMYARIAYNSVTKRIIRFWDALPAPVRKSIMLLSLLTPAVIYYMIKAAELEKTTYNHYQEVSKPTA